MNSGNTVFSQLMSLIPDYELRKCIDRYRGDFHENDSLAVTSWIKQHLHIKTFYGTSQNAVFTQIWIAICDYQLLIIALKMYYIEQNLYIFSNVIGQVLFERTPLNELFDKPIINQNPEDDRQLLLW